ncbi:PAAR domain-containing protein [Bosea vestrisii]|uniref:PAAR domain-containing protein n=1 Tax=Bosea vestrisii TaxID=151416 RepID=A0ABW0HCU9_9HYPH
MPGIAVKTEDSAGGTQLAGGQDFVTVDGKLVVLLGDPVEPHPTGPPHSTAPVMAEGCAWLTINGKPVCREGHKASCGHPTTGRAWVQIVG